MLFFPHFCHPRSASIATTHVPHVCRLEITICRIGHSESFKVILTILIGVNRIQNWPLS